MFLWRIPHITPLMTKYFLTSPSAKAKCLPMLLSAFSHHSFLHFSFNMFALWSFGVPLVEKLGKEHFLSIYLSSAVFSSLTSAIYKVLIKSPNPSLGASGALFAMLGIFGTLFPDRQLQLIFLPNFTFSAENGIKGLATFDACGMLAGFLLKNVFLDHAAHLGGLLFGVWWITEGHKLMKPVVRWWHENRNQFIGK